MAELLVVIAITSIIILVSVAGMVHTVKIAVSFQNSIEFEKLRTEIGRNLKYTSSCGNLFGDGTPDTPQVISLSVPAITSPPSNVRLYQPRTGGVWLDPTSSPPINTDIGRLSMVTIQIEPRTLLPSAQGGMDLLLADLFIEARAPEGQAGPSHFVNRQPLLLKVDSSNRIAGCNGVNPEGFGPMALPTCTPLQVLVLDDQEQWVCRSIP